MPLWLIFSSARRTGASFGGGNCALSFSGDRARGGNVMGHCYHLPNGSRLHCASFEHWQALARRVQARERITVTAVHLDGTVTEDVMWDPNDPVHQEEARQHAALMLELATRSAAFEEWRSKRPFKRLKRALGTFAAYGLRCADALERRLGLPPRR